MKTLITSALPYINGIKHLGNLVGSILPADVYARYKRQIGDEVLYICATDEHGTPAELAALAAGQNVADFCREQHEVQKAIYERFHIAFDYFGRSSSSDNHELTQHFAAKLDENGFLEERSISQVYSLDDGRYLPDRYVEGECPNCGYEKARGDQCESCTKLLDPTDLINPRSAVSGGTNIEVRETKHLFLKQSALIGEVEEWINQHADEWPHLVTSIAKKWIKEGVRDRCITRDLDWGVPVHKPGFDGKVFYVWFDAPIAYIAATKTWADAAPEQRDWKNWWTEGNDVHYVQFMAKDNIPFHTISFPATEIGSREPWKKVDQLKGFNWLTYYGGKFSTSSKRGIFTDQALAEEPADYWRYWLMANAPESSDSVFTMLRFAEQCNKDLAHTLGNFINRGMKFCEKQFGAEVPAGGEWTHEEQAMAEELAQLITDYTGHMDAIEIRKAMASLRAIWSLGNNYLASAAPWTAIKTDRERAACIIRTGLNLTRLFAILAWPVIPDSASKILASFDLAPEEGQAPTWPTIKTARDVQTVLETLPAGHAFTTPPPLFKVIDEDRVTELTEKYGGQPEPEPEPNDNAGTA